MNCPKCKQSTEIGALFCGNCGQVLRHDDHRTGLNNLPDYAIASHMQHKGDARAMLALLFGIVGIVGTIFMALLGLGFGLIGLAMGTMSRHTNKRKLSTAGMVVSSLAIAAGLSVSIYATNRTAKVVTDPKTAETTSAPASNIVSSDLSTPCYSVGLVDRLNISYAEGSCDMQAFDGQTINNSTVAYKVYAKQSQVKTDSAFYIIARRAIEADIKANLPGFTVDNQQTSTFAGSPAYIFNVSDKANKVVLVEAAVFHPTANGKNIFVLVHAATGDNTDLQIMEAQWQWK